MRIKVPLRLGICIVLVAPAFANPIGDGDRLEFDLNFRARMTHYATVDRAGGKIYELFINDRGLRSWTKQRHLISGTEFAIESFAAQRDPQGTPLRDADGWMIKADSDNDVHLSMKSAEWAEDGQITTLGKLFGEATTDGTWRMGAFDPRDGRVVAGADIGECHACHQDRRAEDFILSRGLLDRFLNTDQPARIAFDCPEREICFGRLGKN